jgi:3-hydroxyacyl-CoA dehydrogenase
MKEVRRVLVIGAGIMGHGIAQAFAQESYDVALVDVKQEMLDRARVLINSSLENFAKFKLIKRSQVKEAIAHIQFTTSLDEAARDADIAIEAVSEDREIKAQVFDRLDLVCPPRTILASNTTALNIFEIEKTSRPDKVLITHWYTPPQIIPLVDVVKGPKTSEATVQLMIDLLRKIGKAPLLLRRFVSGYIISRLQIATLRYFIYSIMISLHRNNWIWRRKPVWHCV